MVSPFGLFDGFAGSNRAPARESHSKQFPNAKPLLVQ
jgi:hypothetical protein